MKEALMSDNKTETENLLTPESDADKKFKLLGFYDYTVVLTYVGMLTAFVGITAALAENFVKAAVCLMVAGFCDMFDGAVASTKKRSACAKRFGIQIDSLSDLISFGMLPAIFTYCAGKGKLKIYVSAFYLLCALIRLAYYNVTEEERQNKTENPRSAFLGLPVTSSALIIPPVYSVNNLHYIHGNALLYTVVTVMGIAFLLPVNIKKPALLGKIILFAVGCTELFLLITRAPR